MDSLSVYIPMDRRQALARRETLPDRCRGAALFADISGFTPLTAVYAQELGPQRGAEELIRRLNQIYDALIRELHWYGGSVISFSGDGLTCWLDGDDGRRALACAQAMQTAMSPFRELLTPGGRRTPLALKAAITVGAARRFLVGQPDIQRLEALAGATLSRLGAAESVAEKADIAAGAELMARFGGRLPVREWRRAESGEYFAILNRADVAVDPAPWPETPPIDPEIGREWLLPPVAERLERGEGEFLAQLRPSVALFLKFSGIDYDLDNEAGLKLDAYIRWAQRVLAQYHGYLLQLTIGEKGSYIYAAFGAPLAHEQAPASAVAAALELKRPPRGLRFGQKAQIGISQGLVRIGAYGGRMRRTYGAQGNEVNVASRLMNRAQPGQAIVSPQIVEGTAGQYSFRTLGPVTLKGVAKPMPLFAVEGRKSSQVSGALRALSRQPMVGRAAERALLRRHLQALRAEGRGGAILIEGEAGIGKSRLAAELLNEARASGVKVLLGAGAVIEQSTPYYAWQPILQELLGLAEREEGETAWRQATAVLAGDPQMLDRAALLNDVLPLTLPDSETTRQLSGELRATNTRDLLVYILRQSAAAAPCLLVMEDAHWLDSASWALLEQVRRELPSLMLVIATRPLADTAAPISLEYTRLRQSPDLQFISLEPLPPADAEALVCQRLGVNSLPPPLARLIRERAEGHPFFSEELAFALRDRGLIKVENGRCQLAADPQALQTLDFPDTIQQVITSRIDRLTPGQQLTLKIASVIGRVFALYTLAAIHPVAADKPRLPVYLDTLTDLDITNVEAPAPENVYVFKHIITQEAAYNLLLFAQRRELHKAVAQWYEQTFAADLAPYYPVLAHHWQAAEETDKAVYYLNLAGERALRSGVYREAARFFNRLLQLCGRPGAVYSPQEQARWERLLAEAYWGLGNARECIRRARRALALLGAPEPERKARVIAGYGWNLLAQGVHLLWPSRFLGRLEATAERVERSHAYRLLSQSYFFYNEFWRCYYAGGIYINLEEQINAASPALAVAYANTGMGLGFVRLHKVADLYGRRALELAEKINSDEAKATALVRRAMYTTGRGCWQESAGLLREAAAVSQRIGDWRTLADSWQMLGYLAYYQGDFHQAGEWARQEYALALRQGNLQQQAWALHLQALFNAHSGSLATAVAQWEEAAALHERGLDQASHLAIMGGLSVGYLRQGEWDRARETAVVLAEQLAHTIPFMLYLYNAYTAVPQVCLALWRRDIAAGGAPSEWAEAARNAVNRLRVFARSFPIAAPRAWLYTGREHWLAGRQKRAQEAWRECVSLALARQMPYEEALAHAEIARHLPPSHPARVIHKGTAVNILTRLGAAQDLRQLEDITKSLDAD